MWCTRHPRARVSVLLNMISKGSACHAQKHSTANIYTYTPIICATVYMVSIRHCKRLLVVVYKFLSRKHASPRSIQLTATRQERVSGKVCPVFRSLPEPWRGSDLAVISQLSQPQRFPSRQRLDRQLLIAARRRSSCCTCMLRPAKPRAT